MNDNGSESDENNLSGGRDMSMNGGNDDGNAMEWNFNNDDKPESGRRSNGSRGQSQ